MGGLAGDAGLRVYGQMVSAALTPSEACTTPKTPDSAQAARTSPHPLFLGKFFSGICPPSGLGVVAVWLAGETVVVVVNLPPLSLPLDRFIGRHRSLLLAPKPCRFPSGDPGPAFEGRALAAA